MKLKAINSKSTGNARIVNNSIRQATDRTPKVVDSIIKVTDRTQEVTDSVLTLKKRVLRAGSALYYYD